MTTQSETRWDSPEGHSLANDEITARDQEWLLRIVAKLVFKVLRETVWAKLRKDISETETHM